MFLKLSRPWPWTGIMRQMYKKKNRKGGENKPGPVSTGSASVSVVYSTVYYLSTEDICICIYILMMLSILPLFLLFFFLLCTCFSNPGFTPHRGIFFLLLLLLLLSFFFLKKRNSLCIGDGVKPIKLVIQSFYMGR
ncbi:hypothetical protein F5X99DRAFT_383081 [Biscogniauxia marginata]|nr:hypothetical protein F5X99DRAFT_383081 [Biscogniauxia marginata]